MNIQLEELCKILIDYYCTSNAHNILLKVITFISASLSSQFDLLKSSSFWNTSERKDIKE